MVKTCRKCHCQKPLVDFPKRKSSPDGVRNECKACTNAMKVEWVSANPEKAREYNARYLAKYPEKIRESARIAAKKRRAENPDKLRGAYHSWWLNNKEKAAEATARWLAANPERRLAYQERARKEKRWRNTDPAHIRAKAQAYQARKSRAAPPWLTEEHRDQMIALHARAVALERETGIRHHVDHIFPLKGKNFSGLHVPWNLQVLPARDNISKNNRVTEDMLQIVEVFQW